ncbi:hypothetical protein OS493_024138 [Desmophyllum pertusum]|uniref:Uncharacterized protein n=1 Tax=Desmophyllum pertusum TaxID=174260 RepID=A0A9X0CWJ3_9CNID|nr:hypothetical protein OS493_024138 [Desmophyllum pertusum]
MSRNQPPDPSNSFCEIVQVGRNFVDTYDVAIFYNSKHGRGGKWNLFLYALSASLKTFDSHTEEIED